jgi:hypothetical protein
MAITQPTYPSRTDDLVTHVGAYVDARETAIAVDGRIAYNIFNVSWPARPTATVVFWLGGSEASNNPVASMSNGDAWFPSSA